MQPKVSIIVPCYGVEKYLDRCMESLVNQTLKDIEIILVDDKSPDRVPEMCDEWAKKDERIRVIHKEKNEGLGFARNTGLEVSTGEYVAFVDSDDYVDVKMYEKLYSESRDADVVYGGFFTENRPNVWIESKETQEKMSLSEDGVYSFLLDMIASASGVRQERKYQMSVWHGIYNKSVIDKYNIRFPSEREVASEDLPFQVDFLFRSSKIVYITGSYYYYCLNGTSLTSTYNPNKYERFKRLREVLVKKRSEDIEFVCRCNRFFIGYTRKHLLNLIHNKRTDEKEIISHIVNDNIWHKLEEEYPTKNLSGYHKIVYSLIVKNKPFILLCFLKFVAFVSARKNFRKNSGND
ncbi:MAG: glycosyltransferase [Paludibacteraceae bacterium]|nr:glycosyltransferase [Paludibacteraceae bacterium]